MIIIPYAALNYYEYTEGYMIASTTGWIFFVLLNAYYSGAMTMFFTSEIQVPFNTVEDVMKAYPDWKLKFMGGNGVFFQYKAIQVGDFYILEMLNLQMDALLMIILQLLLNSFREILYMYNFGKECKIKEKTWFSTVFKKV